MEQVAGLCGLPRRRSRPLISAYPCERCERGGIDATYCDGVLDGHFGCDAYTAVEELIGVAAQTAVLYHRIGDATMRRELAEGTADGFSNALYEQGQGAEFDCEEFVAMCGVSA